MATQMMPSTRTASSIPLHARQLSYDRDIVSEPHMKDALFIQADKRQYLFPAGAVVLKTVDRIIVEGYGHIFVFPNGVKMRRLGAKQRIGLDSLGSFYRLGTRLGEAGPGQYLSREDEGGGIPSQPVCPDCVAYADARLYKKGVYIGLLDLAKLGAQNATRISSRSHSDSSKHALYAGDPGICGMPDSPWYYDPNCAMDYYSADPSYAEVVGVVYIWTVNPFRSDGVTSYTWSNSGQLTTMLANWNGMDYANLYHVFHGYYDITGNSAFSNEDWHADQYGQTMDFETENSHTFLSRTDVVITSVQTSPNGTQTSTQEPARFAIIATPSG